MNRSLRHAVCAALVAGAACTGHEARAQASGNFVIPSVRAEGAQFTFWDLFERSSGGVNHNIDNPPALAGGEDDEANATNFGIGATAGLVQFLQTGTPNAFVTSSAAIYSFDSTTAFEVRRSAANGEADVSNVIFQTQSGGSRLDISTIRLEFRTESPGGGTETVSLAPDYKALDDPRTGAFSERLVCAFQWNVAGRSCRDFVIKFAAPGPSMPLWQAQLDVMTGAPFVQELGYVIEETYRPVLRFGSPGLIDRNLPAGSEERFFLAEQTLNLTAEPQPGFTHAGWVYGGSTLESESVAITFSDHDERVTALFAPTTYDTWRFHFFNHGNPLLGQGNDHLDDAVSAPAADPDQDGETNFAEYAFGGDPYSPDTNRTQVLAGTVNLNGDRYGTLTFRRWAVAPEDADVDYAIEVSTDGRLWETATVVTVSSELQPDGTQWVTVREAGPMPGGATRLLRATATMR